MYRRLKETYKPRLLNIYNEELQSCGNNTMGSGSWDDNYMLERDDIHQIRKYIGTNTNKFSKIQVKVIGLPNEVIIITVYV